MPDDVLTPTHRHRCMSHIHSKATKPETKTPQNEKKLLFK